jgi:hypothetical protein
MPGRRIRARLLAHVSCEIRSAGEVALAFLMTAGVASCGGKAETSGTVDGGPGLTDASEHDGLASSSSVFVEAAQIEGGSSSETTSTIFVEAAQQDGGETFESIATTPYTTTAEASSTSSTRAFEAACCRDAGSPDAGSVAEGHGVTEGASFPDAGH